MGYAWRQATLQLPAVCADAYATVAIDVSMSVPPCQRNCARTLCTRTKLMTAQTRRARWMGT